MARNKVYFGMLVFFFVAIIIWTSYAMIRGEKEENSYHVTVIVSDSNNDRWNALRLGLEQAAVDYHVKLTYVSTGKFANVDEEIALINRELENGAEGIIVQLISGEEEAQAIAEISNRVAMTLLESDIVPEKQYALIQPDNTEIGRALAEAIKQDFGEELGDKKVGILSGEKNQLSMQQRLQGLQEGLADTMTDIVWCITHEDEQILEAGELLEQISSVDIIVALGNDETEKMVDFIHTGDRMGEDCYLYGVGCSEKVVYYLDKGIIKTLVVPNEFKMGYQGIEAVVKQLKYHSSKVEDGQIDYLVIDQMNMYDPENQKVLFPIVQ